MVQMNSVVTSSSWQLMREEKVETMPPRTSLVGCRIRIRVTVGMTLKAYCIGTFAGPGQLISQLEVERETC